MDAPIRFALIGCGSIAKTQIRALQQLGEQVELVFLCDSTEKHARDLATEFGCAVASFEVICDDPTIDAVTLCTPSGAHADLAVKLLKAGKHVIVEKPMDISVAACETLLAAAEASGKKLGVISQHRFDPALQLIKKTQDAGDLGELVFVEARIPWYRSQEYYDSADWRGTWAMDGGGCLMNQGIHTVDLMLYLAGPVKRVMARQGMTAHERIEVEDLIVVIVEFDSGVFGKLMASTALYPGFPATLGIYGTKGSAQLEGDELHSLAIQGQASLEGEGANAHARQVASGGTRSATAGVESGQTDEWKWGDAHRAQFLDFVQSIREDRPPLSDGHAGINAVRFIQACYRSAEADGIWVSVNILPAFYLVGDSISVAYHEALERECRGDYRYSRKGGIELARADLDRPQGANGGDSAAVLEHLREVLRNPDCPDTLLVNCGLHDIKVDPATGARQVSLEDYRKNLTEIVDLVHRSGKRLVWITTTPLEEVRHNGHSLGFHRFESDLARYNAAALEIMMAQGVPIIDLHQFTEGLEGPLFRDHVHFVPDVSIRQARFIRASLDDLEWPVDSSASFEK